MTLDDFEFSRICLENIVWHVSMDRKGSVSKERNTPKFSVSKSPIWIKSRNESLIFMTDPNHTQFLRNVWTNLKLGEKSTKNISGRSTQVFVLQIFHQKICGKSICHATMPSPWGAIRFYSLLASGLIRCRWSIRWLFGPWGGMGCQFKASKTLDKLMLEIGDRYRSHWYIYIYIHKIFLYTCLYINGDKSIDLTI